MTNAFMRHAKRMRVSGVMHDRSLELERKLYTLAICAPEVMVILKKGFACTAGA